MGRLRVLIIGNSGSGKTSLAHLLANGKPLTKTATTVGCNTFVRLVEYQEDGGEAAGGRKQSYFVELWDVGTHDRYKALRSVFYSQLNGVILVHELANGRSTAGLGRWAAEVARHGTFVAALPEERAAAALGALPVPYLTIANKADLAGGAGLRRPGKRSALLCWLDGLNPAALGSWLMRLWQRRGRGTDASRALLGGTATDTAAAAAPAGAGLTASATEGRIDLHAVDAFLRQLIERRYYGGAHQETNGSLFGSSGPASQGSSRLGGPPGPLLMPSAASGGYFGGSGPPSRDGSRLTLSNAASLNPAGSLGLGGYASAGSGGFGTQPSLAAGGGGAADIGERLANFGSARIDDLDF